MIEHAAWLNNQVNCVDFVLSHLLSSYTHSSFISSLITAAWSRQMSRYQVVTLCTHCILYRQQICAIFFLFSTLGAKIILRFGNSCLPSFFWRDCGQADSAIMPTVIVALSLIVPVLLLCIYNLHYMIVNHVSYLYFLAAYTSFFGSEIFLQKCSKISFVKKYFHE